MPESLVLCYIQISLWILHIHQAFDHIYKARDFPALKPRKPLWVLESGSEIIGFISEKIDKNGDDIIEFIKSVL